MSSQRSVRYVDDPSTSRDRIVSAPASHPPRQTHRHGTRSVRADEGGPSLPGTETDPRNHGQHRVNGGTKSPHRDTGSKAHRAAPITPGEARYRDHAGMKGKLQPPVPHRIRTAASDEVRGRGTSPARRARHHGRAKPDPKRSPPGLTGNASRTHRSGSGTPGASPGAGCVPSTERVHTVIAAATEGDDGRSEGLRERQRPRTGRTTRETAGRGGYQGAPATQGRGLRNEGRSLDLPLPREYRRHRGGAAGWGGRGYRRVTLSRSEAAEAVVAMTSRRGKPREKYSPRARSEQRPAQRTRSVEPCAYR